MKLPISLIIDDGACINPMYWLHPEREHKQLIPNRFTGAFAALCQKHGVKGKFSVMPMPSGLGRIDQKLSYVPPKHLAGFLKIVRDQIAPAFDITPELLSHQAAYDVPTGRFLHLFEDEWVKRASVEQVTEYLLLAFQILKNAGLNPTGVTSPWSTGLENEKVYAEAIGRAYYRFSRRRVAWYFLHCLGQAEPRRPWVTWRDREKGLTVVTVPALTDDMFWPAQDQTTKAESRRVALEGVDRLLTCDGRQGKLRELLDGGFPLILLTHWQSLFANGMEGGLAGLAELLARIDRTLGDQVEWTPLGDLALRHRS